MIRNRSLHFVYLWLFSCLILAGCQQNIPPAESILAEATVDIDSLVEPAVAVIETQILPPPAITVETETGSPTQPPPPTETPIASLSASGETHTPPSNDTASEAAQLMPGTNRLLIDQEINGEIVSRIVFIQMPQQIDDAQRYPVVFAFHGAGGNAQQFLRNPHFNRLIDEGEFVGVYPNGHSDEEMPGGFWHVDSEPTSADDLAFIDLVVQELATYRELDSSRMYAIGFSNGAGMINLLGKSTTHFQGIAPLFSQQLERIGRLEAPAALSVFQFSGGADRLIPVLGGASPVGEFMSAENSALNWAEQFDCATDSLSIEETVMFGGISVNAFTFGNCQSGHAVKYFVAEGIDHGGLRDPGANEMLFAAIWAFFDASEQAN